MLSQLGLFFSLETAPTYYRDKCFDLWIDYFFAVPEKLSM